MKLIVAPTRARGEAMAKRLGYRRNEYQLVSPRSTRCIDGLIIKPDDLVLCPEALVPGPEFYDLMTVIQSSMLKDRW